MTASTLVRFMQPSEHVAAGMKHPELTRKAFQQIGTLLGLNPAHNDNKLKAVQNSGQPKRTASLV